MSNQNETEINAADMPQDYWAWTGDTLIPLGVCEDFDEAVERAQAEAPMQQLPGLFSRAGLADFVTQATSELNHGLPKA